MKVLVKVLLHTEGSILLTNVFFAPVRWDAGQKLAMKLLLKLYRCAQDSSKGATLEERVMASGGVPHSFLESLRKVMHDPRLDMAFKAMVITPPSEQELLSKLHRDVDPVLIHEVKMCVENAVAVSLRQEFLDVYNLSTVGSGVFHKAMSQKSSFEFL